MTATLIQSVFIGRCLGGPAHEKDSAIQALSEKHATKSTIQESTNRRRSSGRVACWFLKPEYEHVH